MSKTRRACASVKYNGTDITTYLAEDLISFSYTDISSGESDSISIKLGDTDKKWIGKWFPALGDKLIAKIKTKNWQKKIDNNTFTCGSFVIDDFNSSGSPVIVEIGAVSTPATESFKETKRTKTWESATVKSIAREIAKRANISLYYDADTVRIDTIEQSNQTDSAFLYSLCETYGLAMKVYYNKIIIFDEAVYEEKDAVTTIYETDMESWSYNNTLTKTYTGAKITYTDASTNEEISSKVGSGRRILRLNERAGSLKDAELKAIAKVNNENKKMTTMKVTIMANSKIVASSNVMIKGLGKLDGKYAVNKVRHTVGKGYTMTLDLRLIQDRIGKNTIQSFAVGNQYTIRKGDTLWAISKKYYGSGAKYMNIYNANADVIEAAAISHGKSSSRNGNLIYPGTVIIIP